MKIYLKAHALFAEIKFNGTKPISVNERRM